MCVSTAPAEFSSTTLFTGRRQHPRHGPIEVLGYQNTATNLSGGPNAMLLHLPARSMLPMQFLDVGQDTDILKRMVTAVRPAAPEEDGMDWMGEVAVGAPPVQVFEHDIYTVLLATDPSLIPDALARVAPHKRPALSPGLMNFYAERYPGYHMAVCCFDTADAQRAAPLLMWYQPLEEEWLCAPAVDSHTGGPPDLSARVATDHWALFGLDEAPAHWGAPVTYRHGMSATLRAFLPDRLVGARFSGSLPNGDFAAERRELLTRGSRAIQRRAPA